MKKVLRGAYIVTCYAAALPIVLIGLTIMTGMFIIRCIANKETIMLDDLRDMIRAVVDGVRIGHWQNMQYVKYGRNYHETWFSEQES